MNVDGFARLLTDYCLEVSAGQQADARLELGHPAGGEAP